MFNFLKVYAREVDRVRSEEPYYTQHGKLWKYYFKWRRLVSESSVKVKLPWISFPVIEFLEHELSKDSKVFEYGGGGSTLFFTERAKEVVTVEHNKEWFDILVQKVHATNWVPCFVEPHPITDYKVEDAPNPDKYVSTDKDNANKSFIAYASAIDTYPNEYFDIVLVDGRARPSCIKHGIPKIKKGGCLILDNSDRPYYTEYFKKILEEQFEVVINHSGPTPFCSWFNRTSVWRKK